jgi:hypothetical protein
VASLLDKVCKLLKETAKSFDFFLFSFIFDLLKAGYLKEVVYNIEEFTFRDSSLVVLARALY